MKIEFYTTRTWILSQRHRWRIVADNGKIVAASSEGFWSKQGAYRNIFLVYALLYRASKEGHLLLLQKEAAKDEAPDTSPDPLQDEPIKMGRE